jgi:hypothetical protein
LSAIPLRVVPGSAVVHVDVVAPGALGMREHRRTTSARPTRVEVEAAREGDGWIAHLEAEVEAAAFAADPGLNALESAQFLHVLRSADVLDARHFPRITLAGDYHGSDVAGELGARVRFRGREKKLSFRVRVSGGDGRLVAAQWRGTHRDLGLRPYRALLGVLRLDDALTIRLEARLAAA